MGGEEKRGSKMQRTGGRGKKIVDKGELSVCVASSDAAS